MILEQSKSSARDYAFKFLYSLYLDKAGVAKSDVLERGFEATCKDFDQSYREPDQEHPIHPLSAPQREFAKILIMGVLQNEEEIIKKLEEHLINWKIDQLDKVDFTVLLLGTFELGYVKETPPKVVINEAINLTKSYGANQSASFINGILDKTAKSYGHQHLR